MHGNKEIERGGIWNEELIRVTPFSLLCTVYLYE